MHADINERQRMGSVLQDANYQAVNELDFTFQGREYHARIRPPQVTPAGRFFRRGKQDTATRLGNALSAIVLKS